MEAPLLFSPLRRSWDEFDPNTLCLQQLELRCPEGSSVLPAEWCDSLGQSCVIWLAPLGFRFTGHWRESPSEDKHRAVPGFSSSCALASERGMGCVCGGGDRERDRDRENTPSHRFLPCFPFSLSRFPSLSSPILSSPLQLSVHFG